MASDNNRSYIPPLSSSAQPFQPSYLNGTTRRPDAFTSATSRLDFSTPYIPFTQPISAPYYTHQTGSTTVTTTPMFATAMPYGATMQYPQGNTMVWPQYIYNAPPSQGQFYTNHSLPTGQTQYPMTQSDPVTLIAQLVGQMMQPAPIPPPPPPLPPMLANLMAVLHGEQPNKNNKIRDVAEQFIPSIANHPLPMSTSLPITMGSYDGTSDPEDFMQTFDNAIKTQHWTDPVACHMFPSVLRSYARAWFSDLPKHSITSFADLRSKFIQRFHQKKKHTKTHIEAHLIKQNRDEPLADFIDRYTDECLKIPGLPESQQVSGFILCMDHNRFGGLVDRLTANLPPTFSDAVYQAHDYIRAGTLRQQQRAVRTHTQSSAPTRADSRATSSSQRGRNNREFNRSQRHRPYDRNIDDRNTLISSLPKTPKEILTTEPVAKTFKKPPPMPNKGKATSSEYCEFHNDSGHDTNDCRELKSQNYRAIKEGKLSHLVSGIKKLVKDETAKSRNTPLPPPSGTVLMIHHGPPVREERQKS